MSKQLENVNHQYIRYANCWEDADVLLQGLKISNGDRVLTIGSAGDNSFSLLVNDPEIVVAVDINEIQLHLIELKRAAFKSLSHEEFIQFMGFKACVNRKTLFNKVRVELPIHLQAFWSGRMDEIEGGIIYAGKFEKYFRLFKQKILPLVHTKHRIRELFVEKSDLEQAQFFEQKWNTWRWRALFRLFFSKFVMGRFGRDPQFLKEVKVKVSEFILNQAKTHLSSVNCQHNYFLKFIMTGSFGNKLPHYARPENYSKIKKNLDRLVTFHGLAEDVFKQYPRFSKFNLSNIFEYMNEAVFADVAEHLVAHAEDNARFVYWNLMVERNMSQVLPELSSDVELTADLIEKDLGFFYLSVKNDFKS